MKTLLTGILLTAQVVTGAVAQGSDPSQSDGSVSPKALRQRIDEAIADWRGSSEVADRKLLARLTSTGKSGVPYQCELLDNRRGGTPTKIILQSLVKIRQSSCIPFIARMLTSRQLAERVLAVDALHGLGFKACVRPLLQALGDKRHAVRNGSRTCVGRESTISSPPPPSAAAWRERGRGC